jgi:hypothetical protein
MYHPQWHTLGRKTRQAKWQFFGSQKSGVTTVEKKSLFHYYFALLTESVHWLMFIFTRQPTTGSVSQ